MPLTPELEARLESYRVKEKIRGKGALAVVLYVSRLACTKGLPLATKKLLTGQGGQVLGLGREPVQRVLADYGITQVLAEEGGRTSRGSIGIMQRYVQFLNRLDAPDTAAIEAWWVARVRDHFTAKPFRLRYDGTKGLQAVIQDLLVQAKKRQQENSGTMYQGTMLQHLVGAKLQLAMIGLTIEHHGASVADAVSDRSGDFVIDDTIIHVTTFPGEPVIRKCLRNLEAGAKPLILTLGEGVTVGKANAEAAQLTGRIDIMDAEQFIAGNLHELSAFKVADRMVTLQKLVDTYNSIIDEHETDPSLRIDMG